MMGLGDHGGESSLHSVDDGLTQMLALDLYMRVPMSLDDEARLAAVAGIRCISFGRTLLLIVAPERPAMALVVRVARCLPILPIACR